MSYSLTNDKQISLVLSNIIPISYLRYKIINYKNQFEKEEAFDYHTERWETISSKYFRSFERMRFTMAKNYYSYVLEDEKYIATKDRCLEFYNETGISYQVRDLLLDILDCPATQSETILNCTLYEWRAQDDKLYGILSRKITEQFKE
jgi:hypothetical protein